VQLPKVAALWEQVRTSLWFLPGLMILGAILFSWLALRVDINVDESDFVWWLNQGNAEDAGSLLSALLGSLITMATLVISITMVVLALAAGQLGPRLIRSFVADRRTQAVLGLFIATIVYMLLIFRLIDGDLSKDAVPHFAVTMASALTFVCLVTLLLYVHHLARSIVADTVINRVGADLEWAVRQNLREAEDLPQLFVHRTDERPEPHASASSGYVQAVDYEALAAAAAGRDCLVRLMVRAGHHVLEGRTAALVWPPDGLDSELEAAITDAIIIGREPTPVQDIEFFIRQLVEMALRALSPGINDPFTAIAVIDRLAAALALVMERGDPQRLWSDSDGNVRVVAATSDFDGIVDLSFNQIRQGAAAHPDVLIRLIDALAALSQAPRVPEQRATLRRHLEAVLQTARMSIRHPADLAVIEKRYGRADNVPED
jgi:uncharacterized membrane protein